MTLKGSAFLALWNDVDPVRDAEYNCWHSFEHVPERVGIRGMLSGRRYIARERSADRYFTLYGLESLATLAGVAYADVVDHPTAWSLSMRPSLRNFRRHPCATLLSIGYGVAGAIATMRMTLLVGSDAASLAAVKAKLEPFVASAGITALHLGAIDPDAAFPLPNASATTGDDASATQVLLVEGAARAEVDAAVPRIAAALAPHSTADRGIKWQSFDLALAIERSGLPDASAARQPPRPDLRAQWQ